tara:strand:- start:1651 stop:2886 length:1236 start_codon:yes stop_codon:yes gene_type:complete
MNSDNCIGIIELGNVNLKCVIFKINNDNTSEIISSSIMPSEGIHNGVIVNLTKASNSIRSCISNAEKNAKISLKKINVVVEQPEFLCTKFSKHKKIDGSKIHKDDIVFLLKEAKKQASHNDNKQSIIHIFNYNYMVDGKAFVEEPIDVYADFLSHEVSFITIPKNNLKNINQAFNDCDIEIERLISCTFALGAKLLKTAELKYGSVLVDIGFEKISIGIFKNLALIHSITLPIGINHLSKDIAKVCSLNLKDSEIIRNNIDYAFEENGDIFDDKNFLKKMYFSNSNFRKISKNLILNIVKARLNEILEILKKQIKIAGLDLNSGVSFFIVGGGSNLKNLKNYFSDFFGANVDKPKSNNKISIKNNTEDKFVSCLGAFKIIKDGWETEAIPQKVDKNIEKIGFLSKIFGIFR